MANDRRRAGPSLFEACGFVCADEDLLGIERDGVVGEGI